VRKPIIALILLVVLLISSNSAFANTYLSYGSAEAELLKYNATIRQLEYAEQQAYMNYDNAQKAAKWVNADGATIKVNGEYKFTPFDKLSRIRLSKQKYVSPKQAEYYWKATKNNAEITKQRLLLGLRDMYLAMASSDNEVNNKNESYLLLKKQFEQGKIKFRQGMISETDLEEMEYNLFVADKDLEAAKRNKENTNRNFKTYINSSAQNTYITNIKRLPKTNLKLLPLEEYLKRAVEGRSELVLMQAQIDIKQLELDIYEKDDAFMASEETKREHIAVKAELDSLKLQYDILKIKIENEIKSAYIDIQNAAISIKNSEASVKSLKANMAKLQRQFDKGLLPALSLDQVKLSVKMSENGLLMTKFNYETKLLKLEAAVGLGPGY
jgi:outer membrane protein TolC